jgi:hypothetical protein
MLNFMALYWPQGFKKDTNEFCEANLKALGANVLAFISKLGPPNNKPKMLKVGPQLFS